MTNAEARNRQATDAALHGALHDEPGRVLSVLIRAVGDFDLAEDVLQEAIAAALEKWPADGVPRNPAGWLVTAARRRAIDRLRRETRWSQKERELQTLAELEASAEPVTESAGLGDERLQLIFTCCHPALPADASVALTLKTLGGLSTSEIARAFLVGESTLAQRIVRAKRRIREEAIPYAVLGGVLKVIYLIFNEGYASASGDALQRADLAAEAIRLARVLLGLMPAHPEAGGLLALMLFHEARAAARTAEDGSLILLEEQDRASWDRERIDEANRVLLHAVSQGRPGPYQVQAAIAGVHANAPSSADTDWSRVVEFYDRLMDLTPTAVIALNRAVACAMAHGPARGLELVDALEGLETFHLFHATRGDLLRRLDRSAEAAAAYRDALALATNEAEQRFLERRLRECGSA
jgi:RNA polymerase sigma-70 factor (ECF subfamily)